MIEGISKIIGFGDVLFSTVVSVYNWLRYMVDFIISSLALPVALQPFMPQILGSMIMVVVSLAVIKTILGR